MSKTLQFNKHPNKNMAANQSIKCKKGLKRGMLVRLIKVRGLPWGLNVGALIKEKEKSKGDFCMDEIKDLCCHSSCAE
jgi:hypothetical protein